MKTFEIGDVVELHSGGPAMTVTVAKGSSSKNVLTTWFEGGNVKKDSFPPEALKKVKTE